MLDFISLSLQEKKQADAGQENIFSIGNYQFIGNKYKKDLSQQFLVKSGNIQTQSL